MNTERPHEPSQDLVQRARRGDGAAFEHLVRSHYRQIYRWALGIARDSDEADDVVQEVLVQLHRRLDTYEGRSKFSSWLFQVTRNTALARQRKLRRRRKLMLGHTSMAESDSPVEEDLLDRLHTSQLVKRVRAHFERLPDRQRQVFDLADLQGYQPAEVGEMLGMNPVTVRANLHKARRAIRAKLLEERPGVAKGLQT